jgi:hypothetical protein
MKKTKIDWCRSEIQDTFDFDRIAEILGVDSLSTMDDKYWWDLDEEDRDECYNVYLNGLEKAFKALCDAHGLEVVEVKDKSWLRKVKPKEDWKKSASEILETVNGVGYFHFVNLNEFLNSGPYTPRAATLLHLHYIKRYPDVYGSNSIRSLMGLR